MLSGSPDSEDNVNIASIMFPLILSFPLMKACIPSNFLSSMVVHNALGGECRRAQSTAHMSFDLVRYSVTVDSSSFAVSLFLGDIGNPIIVKSVFWHFATGLRPHLQV